MFFQQVAGTPELKISDVLTIVFKLTDYLNQLWNLFMVFSGVVVGWRLSAKDQWGTKQKIIATVLYLGFVAVNGLTLLNTYDLLNQALADLQTLSASLNTQAPNIKEAMGKVAIPHPQVQFIVYVAGALTVVVSIVSNYTAKSKQEGGKKMRVTWKGALLAESDDTVVVEGNHYFPADSIKREHFRESETHTTCPWKGVASYYDVVVGGEVNSDAAWYYPEPKDAAQEIKDRVAFWRGVRVE